MIRASLSPKNILIITTLFIFFIALAFRLLTPEDGWICQGGRWVEHGHPITAEPSTPCH